MKRIGVVLLSLSILLFICYRLLFVSLGVGSLFMESDSDVNRVGKLFLLVCPVMLVVGSWAVFQVFRIKNGKTEYKWYVALLIAVYGGLLGGVLAETAVRFFAAEIYGPSIFLWTLIGSFALSAVATFLVTQKVLNRGGHG